MSVIITVPLTETMVNGGVSAGSVVAIFEDHATLARQLANATFEFCPREENYVARQLEKRRCRDNVVSR